MMALHPGLVDLSKLEQDTWPLGVKGEDPRLSSAAYGEYILETTVNAIGQKLQELGL
jgi:creatinine amidohydrolase